MVGGGGECKQQSSCQPISLTGVSHFSRTRQAIVLPPPSSVYLVENDLLRVARNKLSTESTFYTNLCFSLERGEACNRPRRGPITGRPGSHASFTRLSHRRWPHHFLFRGDEKNCRQKMGANKIYIKTKLGVWRVAYPGAQKVQQLTDATRPRLGLRVAVKTLREFYKVQRQQQCQASHSKLLVFVRAIAVHTHGNTPSNMQSREKFPGSQKHWGDIIDSLWPSPRKIPISGRWIPRDSASSGSDLGVTLASGGRGKEPRGGVKSSLSLSFLLEVYPANGIFLPNVDTNRLLADLQRFVT
ncbi:hypothetical protein J6590_055376 [Homalodisca vitripennis]|nr:hypothetical protein J6590_055376 [Homalodisca vitripennis]